MIKRVAGKAWTKGFVENGVTPLDDVACCDLAIPVFDCWWVPVPQGCALVLAFRVVSLAGRTKGVLLLSASCVARGVMLG